jgi:hypothetical protein
MEWNRGSEEQVGLYRQRANLIETKEKTLEKVNIINSIQKIKAEIYESN